MVYYSVLFPAVFHGFLSSFPRHRMPAFLCSVPLPVSQPLFLFCRMLSGLFVCLFPGIECRLSSFCSWVFSPALFLILSIPRDAIRHLPHPCASHKTNNPAISDRAVSFSSSVLFAGDGVCGTVIDISGRAAKPDTRADYRLRHHLYMIYHRLIICLFHNNYCLLC